MLLCFSYRFFYCTAGAGLDPLLNCPYAQGSEREDKEGVELDGGGGWGGQVLIPTEATAVKDVSKMSVSTLRKLPSSRRGGAGRGEEDGEREERERRENTVSRPA